MTLFFIFELDNSIPFCMRGPIVPVLHKPDGTAPGAFPDPRWFSWAWRVVENTTMTFSSRISCLGLVTEKKLTSCVPIHVRVVVYLIPARNLKEERTYILIFPDSLA